MRELYLFDFDGTLTKKDSLFAFLSFATPSYALQFIKHSLPFALAKLGVLDKGETKRRFIAACLKGKTQKELQTIATKFVEHFSNELRPQGVLRLQQLMNTPDTDVYIVSASLDIWLSAFASNFGVNLICTKANYSKQGVFTGRFDTPNCNHQEKAKRINTEIDLKRYEKIVAYGDTKGDLAMFKLANETFFKPFRS